VVALLGLAAVIGLVACGASGRGSMTSTTAAGVATLVPGPPDAYTGVDVIAGGRAASVPRPEWPGLAGLVVAREITPAGPLSTYGLDPPRATLRFRRPGREVVDVAIGNPTFDRHGFYARTGGPVLLIFGTELRAPLAQVGIVVGPPT
jgi:hypothetical protein